MAPTGHASTIDETASPAESNGEPLPHIPGYEVIQLLGRGGMGCVYLARDTQLGREVAVKTLLAGASPELVARFREEVTAVAAIHHPNVLQVHHTGVTEGRPYLVMEYVAGGTLGQLLAGKPLAAQEAAAILEPVAAAIQHCHERGILHRDLKPSNILLVRGERPTAAETETVNDSPRAFASEVGIPKIADFGLAKRMNEDAGLTKTGDVLGTPAYMAPEQASGVVSQLGPGVDVYSLGAILYELLTGRPPFQSPDPVQTTMMVLSIEPVSPRQLQPKLPRDIETICLKCLEKSPKKRYLSAGELADDLNRFRQGRPIVARPIRPWEKAIKWAHRRPAAAALAGVSVFALAVILAGGIVHNARLKTAKDGLETSNSQLESANAELKTAKSGLESSKTDLEKTNQKLAGELDRSEKMFTRGHQLVRYLLLDHTRSLARLRGSTESQRALVTELLPYLDHLSAQIKGLDRIPGDITVPELATAYERLASIQGYPGGVNLGETAASRKSFEKALDLRARYRESHPDDIDAKLDLARCLHMLAEVDLASDDRVNARNRNKEALKLVDSLSSLGPDAGSVSLLRYSLRSNIVEVDLADGKGRDAIAGLRSLLPEVRKTQAETPKDWRAAWLLAQVLARLAELEEMSGDLPAAKAHYKEALDYSIALADAAENDVRFYRELAVNFLGYGDLLVGERSFKDANQAYEAGVAMLRRLVAADPNGKSIVRDLTIALEKYGRGLNMGGQSKEAVPLLEEGIKLNRELLRDSGHKGKRIGLRIGLTSLGTVYGELKRFDDQRKCYAEALDLANEDNDPAAAAEVQLFLGLTFEELGGKGELNARRSDLAHAIEQYDAALQNYAKVEEKGPLSPAQGRLKAVTTKQRADCVKALENLKENAAKK
jgi:serine/threonine protein kinase